ncbi:alpha/beta hydrolase [Mycetocola tolaasinivorans]|uniref:Alpha/beta hydrolase n=1 Tax=Mycetocola tolaasinivorans TaxID=76635 RepID=A0A3L6ZYE8_9MICO|nr:alpha/beta hydrolase [Mycetocola tolaasinivorans]RLP72748.1 alpha/beta hydrolase [Mycetocola tolaasinivorans]
MTTNSITYLTRPEGRVAYERTGEGPLIVCIPGMGDLRTSYRHTTPALVAAGFSVITMDLRGHGESDKTFSEYGDAATSTDIVALLSDLNEDAILVGNSMAAGAAVLAARASTHVRGNVLVGPFVRNPKGNLGWILNILLQPLWGRAVWMGYLPNLYAGTTPADQAAYLASVRAALRPSDAFRAFRMTTRADHAPAEAALNTATPTLVVMGEKDPDFKNARAEAEWIAAQTGGRALIVPEAGHYPQSQRPEIVAPAIIEFARAQRG